MGGRQSGEWAGPDQWYMKMEAMGEFAGQMWETAAVDQRLFARDLDSRGDPWHEVSPLPESYITLIPRPESYLAVPDLENLRLLDDVVVDGTETFQITGERRETRTLPERFPERPEGDEAERVTTYTWLNAKEGYLPVSYVIEQDTGLGRATHRTTTEFYDYNAPVVIYAPELNEE